MPFTTVFCIFRNVGLRETINSAAGAMQKSQNGGDIPDKTRFARTIGAVTSTSVTFGESGWFKIATVFMPQATSTAVIKLYGGSGFNVGSFEQAAISELVLRAGNGSPVGITATLWKRSPNGVLECAWINTSGDNYDIYVRINQYAYWLIAQYDYTGNANVTLYSAPEYSETKPANATNGQTYTLYNSMMKPTAGDVEALSVNGGRLNGPLSIGTDNALGGNSIVLGDNDTGLKQNGDGILDVYANNALVARLQPGKLYVVGDVLAGDGRKLSLTSDNNSSLNSRFNLWGNSDRPTVIELDDDQGWHLYSQRNPDGSIRFMVNGEIFTTSSIHAGANTISTDGNIYGSLWGGWLNDWINNTIINRFVQDIRLGGIEYAQAWNGPGYNDTPGYVITGVTNGNSDELIDGVHRRPLQKFIGGVWYNVASI
ncbi:phage tail protein [Salmonella enterica subsp. enterica serovar Kentucky]|nr:phage tail protein [Salmonella enterica subsp. enterica serovar Kentucky]